MADVLYGDAGPTGRLQSTWYKDISSFPKISNYSLPEGDPNFATLDAVDPRFTVDMTNADPAEAKLTYQYTDAAITYPFGYGLSYTTFVYSNLQAPTRVNADGTFEVKVDVTNTGAVDSSEVVQLYVTNDTSEYGANVPKKQLAAFVKEYIPANETKTVELTVDPKNFAIWDVNRQEHIVENGTYTLKIGKSSEDILLTQSLTIAGTTLGALNGTEPANVWDHAFTSNNVVYREVSKERTATYSGGYYAVMSTGSDSWVGIPKVDMKNVTGIKLRAASDNPTSTIEVRTGSPSGEKIATITFEDTGETTYKVPSVDNSGATLHEIDYEEVSGSLTKSLTGSTDLYLLFDKQDIRVDSIQFVKKHSNDGSSGGGIESGQTPSETPDENGVLSVTQAMLKKEINKATISVSTDVKKVELASDLIGELGQDALEVNSDNMTLTLPASVLKVLTALVSAEQFGASKVTITFSPLNSEEKKSLLNRIQAKMNAGITLASEIYHFELSIQTADGNVIPLSQFDEPLTLSLKLTGDVEERVTGIFHIEDDGTITYIGGDVQDGNMVVADINHFSQFAVLEVNKTFDDVTSSHWAHDVIWELAAKQVVKGVSSNTFEPNRPITRAEFTKLLVEALQLSEVGEHPFEDVPSNAWYSEVVAIAYQTGIVKGKSNTTFDPQGTIKREEMAVMLAKAYETMNGQIRTAEVESYIDAAVISEWAKPYVVNATKLGLVNGRNGGLFAPLADLTRAEAAKAVFNMLEL
ncbi:S-layer homology domain-containing protein [Paenibacillus sp. MCAF20]